MSCPRLPNQKVREILDRTAKTGNEHAFVKCADGETTEIVEGNRDSLDIGGAIEECDLSDGPVQIVHTHPNGVDELSGDDLRVATRDDVENVCVAVEGGDVTCESVDSCKRSVEA